MSRSDLPSDKSPNFNARIRETLMTYLGKTGDPLDRGVTLRDLIESGIVTLTNLKLAKTSAPVPLQPGTAVTDAVTPDLTPPPTPTGFTASPAITTVILEHDTPTYTQGHGHLRTRVYGAVRSSPSSPAPTFSNADEITQFSGTVASYATNPATTWHLWIKWESADGVLSATPAGGTNGVVATTGEDVQLLLDSLTGQITESQLFADLSARIDLIDASGTGLVTKVADLETTYGTTVAAAQSAADAAQSASDAVAAKTAAILAQGGAETAKDSAVTAKTNAETAAGNASTSATSAASSATAAGNSASNAATSATTAANSATAAGNSATAAATSATNASTYATDAETASTASSNAKVAAESARDAAEGSATAASTSASTASTKATDAATSATAASTSATNAATSASNAATSATNAATSETNAASSASSASTSATTAANSATAAGNSATAAATSATNASTSATNAETSSTASSAAKVSAESAKTAAEAAKTSAETSATAAATSASTASTKASDAATSATAASTYATNAATSASNASTSETNAATSETNASGYATSAASSLQQVQATATGFDASKAWNFDSSVEGWTASGMTQSVSGGLVTLTSTGGDPVWSSPVLDVVGATFNKIRARIRRVAGTAWQGTVYYSTASHGSSESYRKDIADTTVTGEWRVLEWDMSALTTGGTDWASNTITAIRIDLGSSGADVFDVDWVTIGRVAPQAYSAAIAQEAAARANSDGQLFAQYTVKIDNNGYVSGFGLASETVNGTPVSSFLLRADRFSVVNPTTSKLTIASIISESSFFGSFSQITTVQDHGLIVGDYVSVGNVPELIGQHQVIAVINSKSFSITQYSPTFTVTASSYVALVTVPFIIDNGKTYIRSAMIADATITNAKIGDLAVTDGKISSMGVAKLDAGSLKVGSYIQSSTYTPGSAGWRINADGTAELNNITARGTIYAAAGTIGGITIDTVGLRSGQSAWNVGSGFYIGNDGKFSIGTPNAKYLTWDNSLLKFSGSLQAADGTFSGALQGATGTFSGSLTAGVVDLAAVVGQSFTYATAGTFTVVTMPYTGTVRAVLVGGGGGGGGGRGNTDARTDTSGLSGAYGNQYSVTITNVPQGYIVKVIVATGGAGGSAGAVGNAGGTTYIQIFNASNVLQTQYSASGGAGGAHYRYNDNPDSGITGNLVARANSHSFRFPDAGDGAGWGSGQTGLPAPDVPNSSGGLGGFYDKETMVYWGSLTESRRSELNGSNGVRGGGGGGGMGTRGRSFSDGSFQGYRAAVYTADAGTGGAESNGGNGGDGYAFVEIFNPNGVVLASEFQALRNGLLADSSVGLYNWTAVYTNNSPTATSETVDILTSYGHGSYWVGYSTTPTGAINLSAYQGSGWTKPTGNLIIPKYTAGDDGNGNYVYSYLRVIYKANFKVVGTI